MNSDQVAGIQLLDDLQRNDAPATFSSGGLGAGKWSWATAFGPYAASKGAAYNTATRLGYGSPAGWSAAWWNAQHLLDAGQGVGVKATLTAPLGNGEAIGLFLNIPRPDAIASAGYELYIVGTPTANLGTAYLYKFSNGNVTTLASGQAVTTASRSGGTTYALVQRGSDVSAWGSINGGPFLNPPPFTVTDPTPAKTGYAGLQVNGPGPSLDNFSAGSLPPTEPVITSTVPASPGSSTTPLITGSAEAGSVVRLFANGTCSGVPVSTGSAATFTSPGLAAAVKENSAMTFSAAVTNGEGASSPCSNPVSYVEDSVAPPDPTLAWTDPPSPGMKTSIHVFGTAEGGSTIRIYANNTCSGTPANIGSSGSFSSGGIAVNVVPNSTSTFYGTATDRAGNISPCSRAPLTYTNSAEALLFEAAHIAEFPSNQSAPGAITEVPDPGGSGRAVFRMTVSDGDVFPITPSENPRAQLLSPPTIETGSELWWSTRFYLPADFPSFVPGWLNVLEGPYGPPFYGSPPWQIQVVGSYIQWTRNGSYGFDVPWRMPLEKEHWISVLVHERLAASGYVEMWINGSPITFFNGGTYNPAGLVPAQHLVMSTQDMSNSGGGNSIILQNYRQVGMFPSVTVYEWPLKIGLTRSSVGG